MPQPPRHDRPPQRPSDRHPAPEDVTDRLLWALAVDVAAAHQPGPDGSCTNLQCRGQRGTCWALTTARRAAQLLRCAATSPPPGAPTAPPQPPAPLPRRVARGRASVPPPPGRVTTWFGESAPSPAAPAPSPALAPSPPPPARPATFASFRRPPVAALAA